MNLSLNTNSNNEEKLRDEKISSMISQLYANSYSDVGDDFLDCLVREIAQLVNVQTVLVQRLLTLKEYQDLKDNEGCPSIQLVRDCSNSSNSSPTNQQDIIVKKNTKLEFMLTKACYSKLKHETFIKYAATPIALLQADSPQLQTIYNSNYNVSHDASMYNTTYPPFHSFVGTRLDHEQLPIGLISIMHDKPLSQNQIYTMSKILNAVKLRTKNEIEKIRQRDNLMMVKNAALQDAENKIKFLADMSHEIRTPMGAVIALTDLLLSERNSLNEEQSEHLEVIQTSGNHLLTVVNDILDISKINQDPQFKLESRRFSLKKCVKDALNMAGHQASMTQYNKLVCVTECPPEMNDNIPLNQLVQQLDIPQYQTNKKVLPLLWKIDSDVPDHLMGDTMRLTQILLNLCSNAVKFTKHGGIRVKIQRYVPSDAVQQKSPNQQKYASFKERYDAKIEGIYTRVMRHKKSNKAGMTPNKTSTLSTNNTHEDETTTTEEEGTTEEDVAEKVILEISVTDTGIGMPADRLPRLFKSFSQIDISTARKYGGTGLGLAISSMLVNRMGGGLWVESEEGRGSRFALTLPLTIATRRPVPQKDRGSESGSSMHAYNNSMLASPPSPSGSSISDGGSSVGSRNEVIINSGEPSSPSTSTSYFPPVNQINSNNSNSSKSSTYKITCNNNTSPWESLNIPSTNNNNTPTPNYTPQNENKELHNMMLKSRNSNNEESAPVTNTKRLTLAKQYHHRKPNSNTAEENLALVYPIKIMLAEDNVLNQKIAISILKRLGYQDVIIAGNGREALELMRIHKFDVIFMDLYMPEMDGLEATRFIISERKHNIPPPPPTAAIEELEVKVNPPPLLNVNDVYIIAFTASASKQDRQICIDAGMNDFISKPFTMMEMKSALKNCASKQKKRKKLQQQQQQNALVPHDSSN